MVWVILKFLKGTKHCGFIDISNLETAQARKLLLSKIDTNSYKNL
jgi:hypothetical protein